MSTYYFLPTRNVFGMGASQEAGELMKSLGGHKTMIVTDKFLHESGMAGQIQEILAQAGVDSIVFPGAEPNPTDKNVAAGVAVFQENGCDSILSLGGGSSHDCAKGIGMVAANGGTIHDYEGIDKSSRPPMPLMAVNTTAGTASEITRFCIITDTSRKVKMAIVDWRVTPQIAINDPELMKGMPPLPHRRHRYGRPHPRHRGLCVHQRQPPHRRGGHHGHPDDHPLSAQGSSQRQLHEGQGQDGLRPVSGWHRL